MPRISRNNRGVQFKKWLLVITLSLSVTLGIHATPITDNDISEKIKNSVIRHITQDPDIITRDIHIKVKSVEPYIQKIPENTTHYIVRIPEKARFGGSHILPVVFLDKLDREIFQLPVHFQVTVYGKVFKAIGPIEKGTILNPSQVQEAYESINGLPPNRIRHATDILGYESIVTLQDGIIITPYQIRRIPTIRSGQVISARIQKKGFNLTIAVKALENGFPGQKIKAKTLLDSGKILEGTVINNETIEVNSLY